MFWKIVSKPYFGEFHYSPFPSNDTNLDTSSVSTKGRVIHKIKGNVILDYFDPVLFDI